MKFYDTERQLAFLEVCAKGDRLEAEQLLRSGDIDVNFQHGINQWTALHWAAKRGHEKLCAVLLDAGFSPDTADSQNRTPYDVCSLENISLRNSLCPSDTSSTSGNMHDIESPREVNGNKFTPGYIKHPQFPYSKQASLDGGSNPSSPTTRGYYSYGRRDSATRTRFLLVRTSCGAGKEAFKRITLPGGSTVEELRKTVENAMKQGHVQSLMTLPDNVLIEEASQIEAFDNCQKIDVIFGEPISTSPPQTPTTKQSDGRRRSLQTLTRDDTPDNSESSSPAVAPEHFAPKFPQAVPEESAKMNSAVVTPPPSPTVEAPPVVSEEEEDEEQEESEDVEPTEPAEVSITTNLYFKKEQVSSETEQQNAVPIVNQEHQDIMENSKKWTTVQQVAAVAAAMILLALAIFPIGLCLADNDLYILIDEVSVYNCRGVKNEIKITEDDIDIVNEKGNKVYYIHAPGNYSLHFKRINVEKKFGYLAGEIGVTLQVPIIEGSAGMHFDIPYTMIPEQGLLSSQCDDNSGVIERNGRQYCRYCDLCDVGKQVENELNKGQHQFLPQNSQEKLDAKGATCGHIAANEYEFKKKISLPDRSALENLIRGKIQGVDDEIRKRLNKGRGRFQVFLNLISAEKSSMSLYQWIKGSKECACCASRDASCGSLSYLYCSLEDCKSGWALQCLHNTARVVACYTVEFNYSSVATPVEDGQSIPEQCVSRMPARLTHLRRYCTIFWNAKLCCAQCEGVC